jgi:preprotein translocase subunit SecD
MFLRIASLIQHLRTPAAGLNCWASVSCSILMMGAAGTVFAEPKPAGFGEKSFSVRVQAREDDKGAKLPVTRQELDHAVDAVESRLDSLGFKDVKFSQPGGDGFTFSLKGVRPAQGPGIIRALGRTGRLELREVSPRSEETDDNGKTLAERVLNGSEIVPGYRAYKLAFTDEDGKQTTTPILLNRRIAIGSSDVELAVPAPQQEGAVNISLNRQGADKMIAFTKGMRPGVDRIAILIDGNVISAPVVNQVPLGKHFIIEGLNKPGEPRELADSLNSPLQSALVIEELPPVEPEKDAK